ncbi:SDR family NAD(P)-dependent oxidoreductase [Bacillus vallismortis]|uniref:SDR family NAD(P)-dependent oxidoreductase n=1 Tax=Bacillus vallismortis TaxID=72361 RepID=UPI00227E538A|nr:SDR family NAD(P)-dependent oxidoreductase [Bacillus vallismortis]MCY7917297.1 SDR family NAD(P)-dependent oxidoreductase [Bacillus vallismortis]
MQLANKVALVTGSTRGIGNSLAYRLAREGALVVINGTDSSTIKKAAEDIRHEGLKAIGIKGNVSTMEAGKELVCSVLKECGKIDILINNAGIVKDQLAINMAAQEWNEVIDVNLTGTFSCISPVLKDMKKRGEGGTIINVTSLAGLNGSFGQANYSAAKAGIVGLTWTLAEEVKKHGINVNAVAPAALTDMTRPIIKKVMRKAAEENTAFPDYWKIGTPEDAAEFMIQLALDENKCITGQIFSVNGTKIGLYEKPKQTILSDRFNGEKNLKDLILLNCAEGE